LENFKHTSLTAVPEKDFGSLSRDEGCQFSDAASDGKGIIIRKVPVLPQMGFPQVIYITAAVGKAVANQNFTEGVFY
jgi:hypothetical protein